MGEETSREHELPEALGKENSETHEQHTNGSRINRTNEICDCTGGPTVFTGQANCDGMAHCHLCGKVIEPQNSATQLTNGEQFDWSGSASRLAGESEASAGLGQTFSNGLPSLPYTAEISLEGNSSTGESAGPALHTSLPIAEQEKAPVHGRYLVDLFFNMYAYILD